MTRSPTSIGILDAAVADKFQILEMPKDRSPFYLVVGVPAPEAATKGSFLPRAAQPDQGRTVSGAGLSKEDARLHCLGVAAELLSSCFWGSEPTIHATASELEGQCIPVDELFGFGEGQYLTQAKWNKLHGVHAWIPDRLPHSQPIAWVEARSVLNDHKMWVPADFAFVGATSSKGWETIYPGDSNGCAAAPTIQKAIVPGFFELEERDATANWWYGKRQRPEISFQDIIANGELLHWLQSRRRKTHLLDLTSDLDVPVFGAVSSEVDGSRVAIGFGASFNTMQGAISSLSEMVRMEYSIEFATRLSLHKLQTPLESWIADVNFASCPHLLPAAGARGRPRRVLSGETLERCSELCEQHDFDFYYLDFTRPSLGIPCARVIVPKLSHYKPRLGFALRGRHSHLKEIDESLKTDELDSLFIL